MSRSPRDPGPGSVTHPATGSARDSARAIAYLVDRDGVLERGKGGMVIPEARAFLERLAARGVPYLVATNHSTSSPEEAAREMQARGLPVARCQLLTPLDLLAERFADRRPRRVLARGTPGFLAYLEELGVEVVDDARVDCVVLAFDRAMSHAALSTAIAAVLDHDAALVAVHENRLFRDAERRAEPGLGAWVRAIEYATGARATVIGKPSADYYRAALARLGVTPAQAVMISDDPFGDLAGAAALGIGTVFVLTGKYASPEVLASERLAARPDRVIRSLDELEIEGGGAAADATAPHEVARIDHASIDRTGTEHTGIDDARTDLARIAIAPLQPDHWDAVRAIYAEGLAGGDASFETGVPDWADWDASHLAGCRLVARVDGVVAGWAALAPVSRRHAYRGVAEVSVYVAGAARRRGVGRALLRALVECSERAGFWTLQAAVLAENVASIALHRAAGFREVGRRDRLGRLRGRWRDVVLLERRRPDDPAGQPGDPTDVGRDDRC